MADREGTRRRDADREKFKLAEPREESGAAAADIALPHGRMAGDSAGQALLDWLRREGATFPKLNLREYEPEVRGVHASEEISANETVLAIPLKCLITVEMGQATEIGRKVLDAGIKFPAPRHIFLMLYLLTDMQRGLGSFFYPYYSTLPETLSNMPIFWSEEELKELKGSYLLTQIKERKNSIVRDYREICRVDPAFEDFVTLEKFIWARLIVCSRNFGLTIDGVRTAALVPLADMLNHYRPRETIWTFDNSSMCFTITSLCSLHCGDQVYDSYGKKCNHRFLLNYGFAVENNVEEDGHNPNEVLLRLELNNKYERNPFLISRKKAFLEEDGRKEFQARISMRHTDEGTSEALSYARLIAANQEELLRTVQTCNSAAEIPPLSIDNEIRALQIIADAMKEKLSGYERTIEEDEELLAPGVLKPFSNRRHAVIFLRGEKEVCHYYVSLAEKVVPFLRMDWEELKPLLMASHRGDSDIDRYIQDIVVGLVAKRR